MRAAKASKKGLRQHIAGPCTTKQDQATHEMLWTTDPFWTALNFWTLVCQGLADLPPRICYELCFGASYREDAEKRRGHLANVEKPEFCACLALFGLFFCVASCHEMIMEDAVLARGFKSQKKGWCPLAELRKLRLTTMLEIYDSWIMLARRSQIFAVLCGAPSPVLQHLSRI